MNNSIDRLAAALADRYRIERELGAGGMATVYLAEDLKHHRDVAIKVLRPELAATLGPDRFVREIEIAARLTHPHILMLIDSGEADGFLYYVMPYIPGESLRERLDRDGKLSVDDGIRLTDQVASALSYAHERGVVHRDIKPENILLTGDQAIVADFGIARAVEMAGAERLTGTGLAVGTPAYMSPEQAFGQGDVDGRSDVYALGCVVYETMCGRAPFEAGTPQALLARHAADAVPRLRKSDPTIPVFVERAVERALAKRPEDRFQTAGAFAEALTTGTVVARVGGWRSPQSIVAGAVTVLLLATAGWWIATGSGDSPIERLAVLAPVNLTDDPEQADLIPGLHEMLIFELSQAGGMTVIQRASVLQYQGSDKPAGDIARELNVDALVLTSFFREGDSVGIQARLIDGDTEDGLWSKSYDGDVSSVFSLYRDLASEIAGEIHAALSQEETARPSPAITTDPQAYQAYMRGLVHMDQFTPQDLEIAMDYFNTALEIDSTFAPAYAQIAGVWGRRVVLGLMPPLEGGPLSQEAALRAAQLDPDAPDVPLALASVHTWYEWDWDAAETEFRRAVERTPNDEFTRVFFSHFLTMLKRFDEAEVQIQRALELDPFNPFVQVMYAIQLNFAGRSDESIAQFQEVISVAPNNPLGRFAFSGLLFKTNRLEESLNETRTFFTQVGDIEIVEVLNQGEADGGFQLAMLRAAEVLERRARTRYVKPLRISSMFSRAGEVERAMDWIERGFELRDHDMAYLAVGRTDAMLANQRFQEMLRRMKLPL